MTNSFRKRGNKSIHQKGKDMVFSLVNIILILNIILSTSEAELGLAAYKAKKAIDKDIAQQMISAARVQSAKNVEELKKKTRHLEFLDSLRNPLFLEGIKNEIKDNLLKDVSEKKDVKEELKEENLQKDSVTNKILEKSRENASQTVPEIIPTLKEREQTKTNNPVIYNYLVRPAQLQTLMMH